jgi:hypothetical protein
MVASIRTAAVTYIETEHARLRRKQRGIEWKDPQSAKIHGKKIYCGWKDKGAPVVKYEYKDIFYFFNERSGELVTCYAKPLTLEKVATTPTMSSEHRQARSSLQSDLSSWTSNTVMVVDTSGSMRESDMWGTRNRLGSVWVSIALDYLAHRLESGHACVTDVLSVVTLEKEPQVIIDEEPCTWVLHNRIVDIYEKGSVPPRGHGPFIPALSVAESLLTRNKNTSCAIALLFLSDGIPSDDVTGKGKTRDEWSAEIVARVGILASNFGRRLSFTAIGIGDYISFDVLEKMVDAAKDYQAIGMFRLPSMTSSSLGSIFTSAATSLTATQSEMTDLSTLKQRQVRDVKRESRTKASETLLFRVARGLLYLSEGKGDSNGAEE